MKFLTDRFYNNPRPFYGFEQEGAVWARVISAPANVLSRMSHLMDIFETQISREPRNEYHRGIAKYLEIYYAGRTQIPPDETNGNTPIVSAFEVAWYSWRETKDARSAAAIEGMIAGGEVKNMIDLCYQTLALADIEPGEVSGPDREECRAHSFVAAGGRAVVDAVRSQPAEVEFQTGHALWTLSAAGIPATHPQVAKAIRVSAGRQQAFGGWIDPLQSFENFRTPFRETQFAVLALSSYFPGPDEQGMEFAGAGSLSKDPVRLLDELDEVWDGATAGVDARDRGGREAFE